MTQRYFITIAYDGISYKGWQSQPTGGTLQDTIEQSLATIARMPIAITGAGRTDSGVHASNMVAHLNLPLGTDAQQLIYRLNRLLPNSIYIKNILPVTPTAHARFDATSRTYHYQVTLQKSPFLQRYHLYLPHSPNFQAMNQAAQYLLGEHDFTTFSKTGTDVQHHLCTVYQAEWQEVAPNRYTFMYSANRFLRNMVRATVGTLLDVGRGKITPLHFQQKLLSKERAEASASAPADALFLTHITYPSTLYL